MKMQSAINQRLRTAARSLGISPLPLVLLALLGIAFALIFTL